MIINIARDITDSPGGAKKSSIGYSGEEFRDEYLYPAYVEAIKHNEKIIVDLDGGYGYFSGFLKEAFGGLVNRLVEEGISIKKIHKTFVIISNDNPVLEKKIRVYITEAIRDAKMRRKFFK